MRFRIDLKIFLFFILFYFTKQIETYALIMVFALIHEIGHLIAGLILGMKPDKMEIMPFGIRISFNLMPKDYNKKIRKGNLLEIKKIIVALAGPITNVLMIIVINQLKLNVFYGLMLIYANILLIVFNLMPIYPLDGGRILKGILHIFFGMKKSEKYINNISFVFLLIITFISSIMVYLSENISIFIIIVFLWFLYLKEDVIYQRRNKIYDLLDKSLEIK